MREPDLRDDTLLVDAIDTYTPTLRETPVHDWRYVIDVDDKFVPTLYDFAVALAAQTTQGDSIMSEALAWNENRPYPRFYLQYITLRRTADMLKLYKEFSDIDISAYALIAMSNNVEDPQKRAECYSLIENWLERFSGSSLAQDVKKQAKYVCRPSVRLQVQNISIPNAPVKVSVHAICVNNAKLKVKMAKPAEHEIQTIDLQFPGEGFFEADTMVTLSFKDFGLYDLSIECHAMEDGRNNRSAQVAVTSFLLADTRYGKDVDVFALDPINGEEQTDVEISKENNKDIYRGTRADDVYSPELYIYSYFGNDNSRWRRSANILTDRAIYHPGDTLKFMATLMESKGMERKILSSHEVWVELQNVNGEKVDTILKCSDNFGRISGEFVLPKEGLTGNYMLTIKEFTVTAVMVTDYKAPTFEIEAEAARLESETIEVSGRAIGYNGFPIANAKVEIRLNKLPKWLWWSNFRNSGEPITTAEVTTDLQGNFKSLIDVSTTENLSATIMATSPTGETHEAECFVPFKPYFISAQVPSFVLAGQAPAICVLNSKGEPTDIHCEVTLLANDSIFVPNRDWSNVPSGEYKLTVTAEQADTFIQDKVAVYRREDKMPPMESALFVPRTDALVGEEILVGTSYADSHLLYCLWTPKGIIEKKWICPDKGNFFLSPTLPEGINQATLTLAVMRNYEPSIIEVKVSRPKYPKNLTMKISTMRNRMTPGDCELWTIDVENNLGQPAAAAVVLDVYSKALDVLRPFQWSFNPPRLYGPNFGLNYVSVSPNYCYKAKEVEQVYNDLGSNPEFNLYGLYWPERLSIMYNYSHRHRLMAAGVVLEKAGLVAASNDDISEETEAAWDSDAGSEVNAATSATNYYRLPEVPVALWAPVLTTSADGKAQIQFVAPNANTTWTVRALAYDKDMLSGYFSSEIITTKPIMVQPQLPRFLRVGDEIELRALVMNNTDSIAAISSKFEIFNPLTDEVFHIDTLADEVAAGSSALITTRLTAPDVTTLGIRVRATAENFTDGEQAVIPVLPPAVDVHTGTPIFLPSDSLHVELEIPRGGTLTFTSNAVWECIQALPGLQSSQSRSALTAAAAFFSAATARGLLRKYPEIGRAINQWQAEDSTLVSRLERNADLKLALLSSTPWPGVAQTIDERMARLVLLFTSSEIDKTINQSIDRLANLTNNGGLAWVEGGEPSLWITLRVLAVVSKLNRLGFLPQSQKLNTIVNNALVYVDNKVGSEFARNKELTFLDYVYVRSQISNVRQSTPASRAQAATIQHAVGNWRDYSSEDQAIAAIVLNENDYRSTARQILESLRQRRAWRKTWLCPVMLEAFAKIEPDCPEVEIIRNYFIEQRQSTSWGDGPEVSNLVASILTSGANWLVPAENQLKVLVDNHEVTPEMSSSLGEFRLDFPSGGNVEITKGKFPAWGGVFSQSVDSITEVDAFSSPQLKISRKIEGEFKVGNKIKITIILEASQPIDFVLVKQPLAGALESVTQIPGGFWPAYMEPCPSVTNWYIHRLLPGKTEITNSYFVTAEGSFLLAPAEAQSQLAQEFQAHSEGKQIEISE